MRSILSKKEKVTKILVNEEGDIKRPIIYLRYFKGELMYIGESVSFESRRHLRIEGHNPYDFVRCLNASKDTDIRRKWEAKLVVRLKPKTQKVTLYLRKAKLDYKCSTDAAIIKRKNTEKVLLYVSKKYRTLSKLYEQVLNQDIQHVQGGNLWEKEKVPSVMELLSSEHEYQNLDGDYTPENTSEYFQKHIEDFVKTLWLLRESIKIILKFPEGVIENKVRYYARHIDNTIKRMYEVLKLLLKMKGIVIPNNMRNIQDKLHNGIHPSMKDMYFDRMFSTKNLYGMTDYEEKLH